jgi:ABC-type lipoprotein release transport system permease subunit
VLGEVLIENDIIGATGATLAMLLVTLATTLVAWQPVRIRPLMVLRYE